MKKVSTNHQYRRFSRVSRGLRPGPATINHLKIYCDGGSRGNPGPAAIGFLVEDSKRGTIFKKGKFIGKATNNVAEYQAVIEALEWIADNRFCFPLSKTDLHFYLDSRLVVNQLNGFFKIKNSNLQILVIKIKALENQLENSVFYHFIPRSQNIKADKLVNKALDRWVLKQRT